jgi:hypothetical protein
MRFFVLAKVNGGPNDAEFSRTSSNIGAAPTCPKCGDFVGSLTWQPPYRGELELYGKSPGDLMEAPGGLLMTERFAEGFKAEGLTGLSGFHPVEISRVRRKRRGPKPGPPPRYLLAIPTYGPAAVDLERSRLNRHRPRACTWCREAGVDAIDGLALEEGTWTGEDVFRPRGLWGDIFVSERFMRFAQGHATTNMAFVPIDKFVWDPLGHFHPRELILDPPNKG